MIIKVPSTDPRYNFMARVDKDSRNDDLLVIREIWSENVYQIEKSDYEDGVVVDIGANIGVFSIFTAQLASRVIAVEPQKENFDLLTQNIKLNGFDNIEVSKFAIYDKIGKMYINNDMGNSTLSLKKSNEPLDVVNTTTLEELFTMFSLEEVSVLKIDVEGAEPNIILSSPRSLLNQCKYITIELDSKTGDKMGEMVQKLSETHHVKTLGSWERGGMIFAKRY